MSRLYVGLIVGAVCAMTLGSAPATQAADNFKFSIDPGGIAFAYSDGYWDRDHQWHKWRNSRESQEYRTRYAENYHAQKHTKVKNQGWRDDDHDGVPNNRDRAPENPRRQ